MRVAAFTDTYLPTVNGVSYTVRTWRDRFRRREGRMDVVFPAADGYEPADGEHPVGSVGIPFYEGLRLGRPRVPAGLDRASRDLDVVHAHTPFTLGLTAWRLARRRDLPLVASYHTPATEYAGYVSDRLESVVRPGVSAYERWFYDRSDLLLAPSAAARDHVRDRLGVSSPVRVVPNGVDLELFRPVDPGPFRDRYGLDADRSLVGYTGRHGHEKRLDDLLVAAAGLADTTVVFGGDGPARPALERRARDLGVDARFLGFLDRSELPELYAALDVFAFPSPVETRGMVALEAIACGTPVVAADAGGLAETVTEGETGYHYRPGDRRGFRRAIERALADRERLESGCRDARERIGVDDAIDRLREVYASLPGREPR